MAACFVVSSRQQSGFLVAVERERDVENNARRHSGIGVKDKVSKVMKLQLGVGR